MYTCQICKQWVGEGTFHQCISIPTNGPPTYYYYPQTVDLSEVLKELRRIREELVELNRKTHSPSYGYDG